MSAPVLLAVAHGTRSAAGQEQIRALVDRVACRAPDVDVRLAYVDVQQPYVGEAIPRPGTVIVPLLLSAGYHVRVDIARAAERAGALVAPPLGPDPVLTGLLAQHTRGRVADQPMRGRVAAQPMRGRVAVQPMRGRVAAQRTRGRVADQPMRGRVADQRAAAAEAIVLAAAGSSDPGWRASVDSVAAELGATVAYASGDERRVPDVVAELRAAGARKITVAAYLLAEGLFYRSLHRAGADVVTPPLCAEPAVEELVLARYRDLTMISGAL
ncbi:sirohydrochlorin chelatase [Actinoplanes sp. RD1]|uniref:sirohydrochlorin chelatase n=1 Tax=Actinoplanes sp. RD1 TaxID=3064538 RepID=UPI00274079C5|nr:CbiX/SirB N-terminal domain-containing protein [Actinoplanes sp. RD1]